MKTVPLDYSNGLLYWRNCLDSEFLEAMQDFIFNSFAVFQSRSKFLMVKSYFNHWVQCPFFEFPEPGIREELTALLNESQDVGALHRWLSAAMVYGLDPL